MVTTAHPQPPPYQQQQQPFFEFLHPADDLELDQKSPDMFAKATAALAIMSAWPSAFAQVAGLPNSLKENYTPSDPIKVLEVSRKYLPPNPPNENNITGLPEYTNPGGPNTYVMKPVERAWTQGFFPGLLWLLVEREQLLPGTLPAGYDVAGIESSAREWQAGFRQYARKAINHDQGFRFESSFGRDLKITGNQSCKEVLIEAADSLWDRYDPKIGCIRSWNSMQQVGMPDKYRLDNQDEHFLVIVDNMMNLDFLFDVSEWTGNPKYKDMAISQADKMQTAHVREDGTTFHVVNFSHNGTVLERMTHQGYADNSTWSRGQAWAVYGYAQMALRTGRADFIATMRKVADAFLSRLEPSGLPAWDFDAPRNPLTYDTSAATITASGLLNVYRVLKDRDQGAAQHYLCEAFKLIRSVNRNVRAPAANLVGGKIDWGAGGWETILTNSTINNNPHAEEPSKNTGLVYADYYYTEFGNEGLKLRNELKGSLRN